MFCTGGCIEGALYHTTGETPVLRKTQERQRISLDDASKSFARNHGKIRPVSDLVEAVEGLNALGRVGVGEIAAKKQLINHAVLEGGNQCVVRLPRPREQA